MLHIWSCKHTCVGQNNETNFIYLYKNSYYIFLTIHQGRWAVHPQPKHIVSLSPPLTGLYEENYHYSRINLSKVNLNSFHYVRILQSTNSQITSVWRLRAFSVPSLTHGTFSSTCQQWLLAGHLVSVSSELSWNRKGTKSHSVASMFQNWQSESDHPRPLGICLKEWDWL